MGDFAKKALDDPNQAIIDEGLSIAEPYIPEEHRENYYTAKKLAKDPNTIYGEILK